jgi:hypothetical protein
VLAEDIERALGLLAVLPGIGTLYPATDLVGIRRLYLRRAACHLYYVFDDHQVVVVSLWGTRRERGPEFVSLSTL